MLAHDRARCTRDNPSEMQERIGECRAAKKSGKALAAIFNGCTVHHVDGYTRPAPPIIESRKKGLRNARGLQVLIIIFILNLITTFYLYLNWVRTLFGLL